MMEGKDIKEYHKMVEKLEKKETYKPLPDGLIIKKSSIEGQGIFTTTDGRILEGLFENGEYIDSAYQSNLNPEDVISDDDIVKE